MLTKADVLEEAKGDFGPDYEKCLALAGANVLAFERFGSYSGDWWAVVEADNPSRKFFVTGAYGSCSGCDHLEDMEYRIQPRVYSAPEGKRDEWLQKHNEALLAEMESYGEELLSNEYNLERAIKELGDRIHWSEYNEDKKQHDWLVARAAEFEVA